MKIRKTMIVTLAVLCLLAIITFTALSLRDDFKYSETDKLGNTAGNLYNKGLFCDAGDRIYFSNINDNGYLYSMKKDFTDFQKHYEDMVRYINADEYYIYYSRMNNLKKEASQNVFTFYSNGIFRIEKGKHDIFMLHNLPIGTMVLYKNKLYYQYYNEGEPLMIKALDVNGASDEFIVRNDAQAVNIFKEKLYFADAGNDNLLYSIDLESNYKAPVAAIDAYLPIVTDEGTYYISNSDGYRIFRLSPDQKEKKLIADYSCCTYNVTEGGRYVFFQRDDTIGNGVYVYDSVKDEEKLILAGDYKWFNIAGNYLFFYDFAETKCYAYHKLTGELSEFKAPKIEK